MSKKNLNPNDQKANVKNLNNEAFIKNQKNRAKQLDPNHLASKTPTPKIKKK